MNDDQDDPANDDQDDSAPPIADGLNPIPIPDGSNPNGAGQPPRVGRPPATGVRSGLAERRNPALVALGEVSAGVGRLAFKDPLNTFLLFAAICLATTFAILLGTLGP